MGNQKRTEGTSEREVYIFNFFNFKVMDLIKTE